MVELEDSAHDSVSDFPVVAFPCRATPALFHAGFAHDPDIPVLGLDARPGATVFVADAHAGGEAALAHLAAAPARVVVAPLTDPEGFGAVLRPKAMALRHLDRLEALRLVGLLRTRRSRRLDLARRLAPRLPPADRHFWERHEALLAAGLFNVSAETALGRLLRNLLRTHLPAPDYRKLLYGSPAERLAAFEERLDRPGFWRHALRLCAVRGRLTEPGETPINTFTAGEPMAALRRLVEVGMGASPIWLRAFGTDTGVLAALPRHLRGAGLRVLRDHLDRFEVRTEPPLAALVDSPAGAFDGFDLANLPDYLDADARRALFREVARAARPGARLVFASLQPLAVRATVPARFEALPEAERALAARDRAPVWGRWSVFVAR